MRKILVVLVSIVFLCVNLKAQEVIDPELQGLYQQASEAINQKDYDRAINIYFQAIRMQPNNVILRRDLAYAYYLSGKYDEGIQVVNEVISSNAADEQTYQIASALEQAKGNLKKASRLLDDGLKKFPNSGILYNAKGNNLSTDPKKQQDAVEFFVKGIEANPRYAMNYYNASRLLLEMKQPFWSIIYGEIYTILDPLSPKTIDAKKNLLQAYSEIFAAQTNEDLPNFKKKNKNNSGNSFEDLALPIYFNNYAAVADGFSTENLIMLRTRFMLEWQTKFPTSKHSLLQYYTVLLEKGYFDAYNQSLFGSMSDSQKFANWLKMNNDYFKQYAAWSAQNPYSPQITDPQYK